MLADISFQQIQGYAFTLDVTEYLNSAYVKQLVRSQFDFPNYDIALNRIDKKSFRVFMVTNKPPFPPDISIPQFILNEMLSVFKFLKKLSKIYFLGNTNLHSFKGLTFQLESTKILQKSDLEITDFPNYDILFQLLKNRKSLNVFVTSKISFINDFDLFILTRFIVSQILTKFNCLKSPKVRRHITYSLINS